MVGVCIQQAIIGDMYWVDKLSESLSTNLNSPSLILIDDVRFPNEYEMLKSKD